MCHRHFMKSILVLVSIVLATVAAPAQTWTADNGNGTFTNPLFYDEFSDPDLIRVDDDFYLTGTTMHTLPGLPILHSRDLVNWHLLGYAADQLDLGPQFRLEDGKTIYGQGLWAPSFRYYQGTFYIFSNINGRKTQLFTAKNPAGPWTRMEMKRSLHDLSVLFDDDGKVYVVWGYQDLHFGQLTEDLSDIVQGTERVLFKKTDGMGEGVHFYKIDEKYFITSAWYVGRMRMACARADMPQGPYEVNQAISSDEDFGLNEGNRLGRGTKESPFAVIQANTANGGRMSLHQGGLVSTAGGEWWGFSMMDYNSVGRLTCLSPVTWTNGWPYFGLPGNLTRTPRTWVKPNTGHSEPPAAPYQRNDEFSGPQLANVWQWNHVPDASKWSLAERPGFLRLHSLPAADFWHARNTLTQRAIGPESSPTTELDASALQPGDVAGLALLNHPYAWIGVRAEPDRLVLEQFNELTGETARLPLTTNHVTLRAQCNFLTEKATFSFSLDGKTFQPLGGEFTLIFQLTTFQGVRYSLFNFNTGGAAGGAADFDRFTVAEPHPQGLTRALPAGQTIGLENLGDGSILAVKGDALIAVPDSDPLAQSAAAQFVVLARPLGRVSLQSVADGRFVTVTGLGTAGRVSLQPAQLAEDAQLFQWTEMPRGDLLLLSLASQRHLRTAANGVVTADAPGAQPDRKNGASFTWHAIEPAAVSTSPTASLAITNPITLDLAQPGKAISPDLFGIFFEDLNYAADGGLYGELVQNRSFEYSSRDNQSWNSSTAWTVIQRVNGKGSATVETNAPLNDRNPHYAVLTLEGAEAGLANSGFDGIVLRAGESYDLSVFAKVIAGKPGALRVRLEGKAGAVLGEAEFSHLKPDWKKFTATIKPRTGDTEARLVILAAGTGAVGLDMVSLFPHNTFHKRPNGLRPDLAQVIADLQPKFMRFPGGCLAHGDGLDNMYRWPDTIGPVETRRAQPNIWRYHQTMGLGYFEYFQFCEDIGAKPVPVVPAGVCCQNSGNLVTHKWGIGQQGLPLEEMPAYTQEVLNLIEYANGPVTSTWGAKRAAAGHPQPFHLEYLGVGNEDAQTEVFRERFQLISDAVKARHPEITVIGTVGPSPAGKDFEAGWKFANAQQVAMVDEHYYEKPDWFLSHLTRYDGYDRTKSKVYLGEYAAHDVGRANTLRSALAEAAYMTSLERNGDVVRLASYAPLLSRQDHTQWRPDLIYFDKTAIVLTANYYVQQLFSQNQGDIYLPIPAATNSLPAGVTLSLVRDQRTHDVILKIVNNGLVPRTLPFKLSGLEKFAGQATLTVLTGDPMAVNSFSQPATVLPKTSTQPVSDSFDYEAPASSLTVLRLKPR